MRGFLLKIMNESQKKKKKKTHPMFLQSSCTLYDNKKKKRIKELINKRLLQSVMVLSQLLLVVLSCEI